tara:strand:- start:129 stop:323 length:195 start_codon:yes stop_codon:yes gene_type:complete
MLFKMPLSTKYRNEIIDICCRIISTDGEVSLNERIWMNKLCEHNLHAKELVGSLLSDDMIEEEL